MAHTIAQTNNAQLAERMARALSMTGTVAFARQGAQGTWSIVAYRES